MPTYATLIRYTSEGLKNADHMTSRQEEGMRLAEKMGIKSLGAYAVLGPCDMMYIYEAPDEKTAVMIPFSMATRSGDATTETWTLIPMTEFVATMEKARK